jgi:hypothetical protein
MAEKENKQEKKIIIDEDWKKEAQREKEILAAQEETQKKEQRAQRPPGPLPEGNFAALVSMLTTQALFALGLIQVKGQEKTEPDLELAKYNIDMLEMLEAKTKGNLTKAEQRVLINTLNELRMGYVKVADTVASKSQ